MADFADRCDVLAEMVGTGDLTGTVIVDQLYAAIQHNSLDFHHPRGGQAQYLTAPLMENHGTYLEAIAATVLEDGGKDAMVASMEDLAGDGGVATRAPILYYNLRRSGHPIVTSGTEVVYDRAPEQERLTEEQLRAIYREHHPIPSVHSERELRFLWATDTE